MASPNYVHLVAAAAARVNFSSPLRTAKVEQNVSGSQSPRAEEILLF